MREPKYKVGERVCYMHFSMKDKAFHHHVGYVKQVRKGLLCNRYALIVSNSDIIHIVKEKNIFNVLALKEKQTLTNNK